MGFFDQLQSLFSTEKKVDLNLRFELLTEGFIGTMSKFHKARDRENDQIVGLKLLDMEKIELFEDRFKAIKKPPEGKIAKTFVHDRIVRTLEHGVSTKGQRFIVMEFIRGKGMNIHIKNREERLIGKRLKMIRQMAEALLEVHRANFIHRDVCPRNFIVMEDMENVKLIDFGLTLPNEEPYRLPGNRTGTPMYMAPEIVRRRKTDRRVDMFAFGVSCYQLMTFELPWPHADYTGKGALSHDTEPPVPIEEVIPDIDETLGKVIMKAMSPAPENRPESMDAFLQTIRRVKSEMKTA